MHIIEGEYCSVALEVEIGIESEGSSLSGVTGRLVCCSERQQLQPQGVEGLALSVGNLQISDSCLTEKHDQVCRNSAPTHTTAPLPNAG